MPDRQPSAPTGMLVEEGLAALEAVEHAVRNGDAALLRQPAGEPEHRLGRLSVAAGGGRRRDRVAARRIRRRAPPACGAPALGSVASREPRRLPVEKILTGGEVLSDLGRALDAA